MSRKPKLIAAGAVLAVGFGAACLFRRGGDVADALPGVERPAPTVQAALWHDPAASPALDGQFSPQAPVPASPVAGSSLDAAGDSATTDVAVAVPSLPPMPGTPIAGDADLSGSGATASAPGDDLDGPVQQIHVIHGGDTLELIAERYLGDSHRAWELFDLNRDVLENPHILPLGAELRIPATAATATADER